MKSIMKNLVTYELLLDEANEPGSLDFDRLVIVIVQCQCEVEEVALP